MQNTTIVVYRLTYLCYLLIEKIAVPLQTKKNLIINTKKYNEYEQQETTLRNPSAPCGTGAG